MRITMSIVGSIIAGMLIAGCGDSPAAPSTTVVRQPSAAAVQTVHVGGSAVAKTLTPGGTTQLAATAQRSDGTEEDVTSLATWSSDNESVATVSSSGLVAAQGPGSAHIRAAYQGQTGETLIDVGARTPSASTPSPSPAPPPSPSPAPAPSPAPSPGPVPPLPGPVPPLPAPLPPTVQTVTISGGSTVPMGQSMQLRATGHMSDGTDRDVTSSAQWSTSNPSVASVSQSGVVTGTSPGSDVVTAQFNGASASQPVQVTPF